MSWRDEALCQGKHLDLWFPPLPNDRTESEAKYYELGKRVCEHCPVIGECLDTGIDEEHGLWGGCTPKERVDDTYAPSEYVLIPRYLDRVPAHDPDIRLDIKEVTSLLNRYSDRRADGTSS